MKIHRLLVLLTALSIGFFSSGCDGGSSGGGGGGKNATLIAAIGDSIGTGFGIATPWPAVLQSMTGVRVINNSANGRTTGGGLGVVGGLIAQEPSHLVVLLGTNDALRGGGGAKANLQAITDMARANGIKVILGTLPPITRSAAENARAAAISKSISGVKGAKTANVRGEVPASGIADGIHPNQNGQNNIAMAFRERL